MSRINKDLKQHNQCNEISPVYHSDQILGINYE